LKRPTKSIDMEWPKKRLSKNGFYNRATQEEKAKGTSGRKTKKKTTGEEKRKRKRVGNNLEKGSDREYPKKKGGKENRGKKT